jgi:hypothetical protein
MIISLPAVFSPAGGSLDSFFHVTCIFCLRRRYVCTADLKKLTERVALKERGINKEFENLGAEFRQRQSELEQFTKGYEDLSQVWSMAKSRPHLNCHGHI